MASISRASYGSLHNKIRRNKHLRKRSERKISQCHYNEQIKYMKVTLPIVITKRFFQLHHSHKKRKVV